MNNINRATVIIVDDDESNALLLEEYLRNYDFRVLRLNSAKECLDSLVDEKDVKLIFLDIKMPGMDGLECLKEIYKIRSDLTIVAQTAYALYGDRERFLKEGFNEYLPKPIARTDFDNLMTKLI